MKNSSLKDPFPRLEDKFFDGNHDGKLGPLESAFRDAHIEEMKRRSENNDTHKSSGNYYSSNDYSVGKRVNSNNVNNNGEIPSGSQLLILLFAILFPIGGIALAVALGEGYLLVKALIILGAAGIGYFLLRSSGLHK